MSKFITFISQRIMIGLTAALLGALLSASARADVLEFIDKDAWFAAVGDVTTIDFTGFEKGTLITDQFEDLGVIFNGVNHFIDQSDGLYEDNWGLAVAGGGPIDMSFTTPQSWIAVDFPGTIYYELFNDGKLVFTSSFFGSGGVGFFAGLVSTELFDEVLIIHEGDTVIDNLHFGVPAPGTLALIGLAAVLPNRRRRSRH